MGCIIKQTSKYYEEAGRGGPVSCKRSVEFFWQWEPYPFTPRAGFFSLETTFFEME